MQFTKIEFASSFKLLVSELNILSNIFRTFNTNTLRNSIVYKILKHG
jgi:hypothetical protein